MTPSPPLSPRSSTSSRPSSSTSNSPFQHTHTPRHPFQSNLPPLHQFSAPPTHDAMGAAIPTQTPSRSDTYEASRGPLRLSRQKSDESIRPTSSTPSPQAMREEVVTSADHDAGASDGSQLGHILRPKKKRTRTLTTPHQSAVLHALLAQSRFPTTAMREEVGRSIGLSARKVQVWFQNQRQKARRPRNESTPTLSRPPQFGAFPATPHPEIVPVAGPSSSAQMMQAENAPDIHSRQGYTPEYNPTPLLPSGLPAPHPGSSQYPPPDDLGHTSPQIPRQSPQSYRYPALGQSADPGSSTPARRFSPPFFPAQSQSQGHHRSQASFPPDQYDRRSAPGSGMTRRAEPPIVLPPLRFDQPRGIQTLPPPPIHRTESYFSLDTPRSASRSSRSGSASSISPSSASHFPLSFTLPPPPSRRSDSIPPPFTLQPQPQWGSSNPISGPMPTMPPPTGLSQSSRSSPAGRPRHHRTNSDPARRLPPLSTLLEQERSQDLPSNMQLWPQLNPPSTSNVGTSGRRFDPVHSVLREGAGQPIEDEGGNTSRRNRHTYDFTRPREIVITPSPPSDPDDPHGESHRRSDQARG